MHVNKMWVLELGRAKIMKLLWFNFYNFIDMKTIHKIAYYVVQKLFYILSILQILGHIMIFNILNKEIKYFVDILFWEPFPIAF